jgi:sec-independent protein translocase protein TatA
MGIGVSELLLILAIALVIFGTKKLKNVGSDLGGAIKGFRDAMKEGEDSQKLSNSDKTAASEAKPDEKA